MPKKIPDCAHCGVSLKDKKLGKGGVIMLDYQDAVGKPMIGWHEACWEEDDITDCAQGCISNANMGPAPDRWTPHAVKVIVFRDRSRVSGGARFWRHAFNNALHWLHDIASDGEVVPATKEGWFAAQQALHPDAEKHMRQVENERDRLAVRTNMTPAAARKIAERRIDVWPDYDEGTAIVFNSKTRRRSVDLPYNEAVKLCEHWRDEEITELLDPRE